MKNRGFRGIGGGGHFSGGVDMMFRRRAFALALLVCSAYSASLSAQGALTLATATTQNNGQACVSFSIEAINDVKIHRFSVYTSNSGTSDAEVWYQVGPISGSTSGWTKIGSASTSFTANTNTVIPLDLDFEIRASEIFHFSICLPTTSGIRYTTNGNGTYTDPNIILNANGYGGSYSATSGNSLSFFPRGFNGAVFYDLAGLKWTGGAGDGNWNSPGNWSKLTVPGTDESVIIPSQTEWLNPAVPTTPTQDTQIKGIRLEAGSALNLSSGTLFLSGDFENQGGTLNTNPNGKISLNGTSDQLITTGDVNMGNVELANVGGTIKVGDMWTAMQTGTLTGIQGSVLILDLPSYDFTNTTGALEGDTYIGITGQQSITSTANLVLGNAFVSASLGSDSVDFIGPVGFRNLRLSGDGQISFAAGVSSFANFNSTMASALVVNGNMLGTGVFTHDNTANITINGILRAGSLRFLTVADLVSTGNMDFTGGEAYFEGDGTVSAGGVFLANTINGIRATVSVTGAGSSTVTTSALFTSSIDFSVSNGFNCPLIEADGIGALSFGSISNNTRTLLSHAGSFTVTGGLTSDEVLYSGVGNITVNGNSNIEVAEFGGTGATSFGATLTAGDVRMSNSGDFTTAQLDLEGDLTDSSSGTVSLGNFRTTGIAPQVIAGDTSGNHKILVSRLSANGSGGTEVQAWLTASSTGTNAFTAALQISPNVGLLLGDDATIEFSGDATAIIRGALQSTPASPASRPRLLGNQLAPFFMDFRNGSIAALTGLIIENVGSPSDAYAIVIDAGCTIAAFHDVQITGVASTTAVMQLNTESVPNVITGFDIYGTAPNNIDASGIAGKPDPVEFRKGGLTKAGTLPNSLFGTSREIDPGAVILWEDPPAVDIATPSTLPNALVNLPYTMQLQGIGGNDPLVWSISQAPDWLTLDAVSGLLSGIPDNTDVGNHQFVVTVQDASTPARSDTKAFLLVVNQPVAVQLQIVTGTLPTAKESNPYSAVFLASGGTPPYEWTVVGGVLPLPLSMSANGQLAGTPAVGTVGNYPITIRVADAAGGQLSRSFELKVGSSFDAAAIPLGGDAQASSCAIRSSSGQSGWVFWLGSAALLAVATRRRRVSAK